MNKRVLAKIIVVIFLTLAVIGMILPLFTHK